MKKYLAVVLIIVLLFSISGCDQPAVDTDAQTQGTVSDIFTQSFTETDQTEPTTETKETIHNMTFIPVSSINTHGISEYEMDDIGHCVTYKGGEMHLPYSFTYTGSYLTQYGVALYLCIDGQLQPFKTNLDDTLRYVHIVIPEETKQTATVELDIVFVPIVGQKGDVLDLSVVNKQYALWQWGDTESETSGYTSSITTRIKYKATPKASETTSAPDRMVSWECSYKDATNAEYQSWRKNANNLLGDCMRINGDGYICGKAGQEYRYVFAVTSNGMMEATFELLNTSGVDYGIILFIDDVPVSTQPEDMIYVKSDAGQKALVTVKVDMTDFDGQSKVHAFIVPRNYFTTVGYTSDDIVELVDTSEFFLFKENSWDEVTPG